MGLNVTEAGLSGPIIDLCCSRTVWLGFVALSLNPRLMFDWSLWDYPGFWRSGLEIGNGLIRNLWNHQLSLPRAPIKAVPHKNAPISRSWRLTNFATLQYGMTRLFHCASKHNPCAFRTSISCRFGLQPPSTETPQSQTSSGFSWLMKRKHLTAREHREGKRELWGRGM